MTRLTSAGEFQSLIGKAAKRVSMMMSRSGTSKRSCILVETSIAVAMNDSPRCQSTDRVGEG